MSVLAHEGTYPILYGSYDVPIGSRHSPGYLARPDQAGRFPVVLVLPDGELRSFHKDLCRRMARHGLASLAIDLAPATGSEVAYVAEAHEFLMSADVTWAIQDQFGIVGIGSGGAPGLVYAANHPGVQAVALISSVLEPDDPSANVLARLAVPVLGLYGADGIFGRDVDGGHLPHASFVVYAGVAGSFLDDGSAGYDAAASADAHRRLVEFLADVLPPPQVLKLG